MTGYQTFYCRSDGPRRCFRTVTVLYGGDLDCENVRRTLPTCYSQSIMNIAVGRELAKRSKIIQEGPFATVASTWVNLENGETKLIVIKSSSTFRKFSKEPHDIEKELRLLASIQHPNIVPVLGSFRDEAQMVLNIYLPYLPISLSDLLASPSFSPYTFGLRNGPEANADNSNENDFNVIARSVMIQTLSALSFLHHVDRRIAHRDIKPQNIMLTNQGCVRLIDFGVACKNVEYGTQRNRDLWPEQKGRLYFEVSTGPYRAPELLFGSRNYDPIAIDLWSLGACFAEFFTPLRLCSDDIELEDEEDEVEDGSGLPPLQPFIIPLDLTVGDPGSYWRRNTLFNGNRGELGLTWSIFKILGTPTADSWPEFVDLPGAKSVVFNIVPSVDLPTLLPNLPPPPSMSQGCAPLDLLAKLLTYPPTSRLSAENALKHPWLKTKEAVLLLPNGYALDDLEFMDIARTEYRDKTLGELLHFKLSPGQYT